MDTKLKNIIDDLIDKKYYEKAFELCYSEIYIKGNNKDSEIYYYMAFIKYGIKTKNHNVIKNKRFPVNLRCNFGNTDVSFFDTDFFLVIDDLNRTIELDKNNIMAYLNRGIIKYNICRYGEAIEDLNIYLDIFINPSKEESTIYAIRGYSKYCICDYNGSIEDINIFLNNFHDTEDLLFKTFINNKINCLINLEKYDEALECDDLYNSKVKNYPLLFDITNGQEFESNPYELCNRAYIYYKKGISGYKEMLNKVVEIFYKRLDNPNHINTPSIFFNIFRMVELLEKDSFKIVDKILDKEFRFSTEFYIEDNILFNYTKINFETIKSIFNNEIWLSHVNRFNDPIDPFLKSYDDKYKYLIDRVKVACLTSNNKNTLMWSHYADKHQGICIGYNIKRLPMRSTIIKAIYDKNILNVNNFFRINYDEKLPINNIINKKLDFEFQELLKLFVYKSKEWEYEDEYRLLYYDEQGQYKYGIRKPFEIKTICFGAMTKEEDKEFIYKLLKERGIKFYQAKFDKIQPLKINIFPYNE